MKQIVIHILFWVIFAFWTDFITDWTYTHINCPDRCLLNIGYTMKRLPLIMASTYFLVYFILPKYLIREKQYLKFSLSFLLLLTLTTLVDRLLINFIMDWGEHFFSPMANIRNTYLLLSAMGLASLIRFFELYQKQERSKHKLAEENLKSKLSFLRAQVNPHFQFNALNNIYSMAVQKGQSEIAAGIENLSGIMKYLTYDSNSDLVPLEKEIKLIQDYIDIQQLRMAETDDTTLSFKITGDIKGRKVAPVILLPLVENAFKHGVKPEQKCLVSITLSVTAYQLHFKIMNTFFEKSTNKMKDQGIGLENVKDRLRIVYPEGHRFSIRQEGAYYVSELEVDLK
ncbi:sensor histidine kinase [Xanthovirga aplysinae]|uniref:sensor histidine kinase n=1 Tax=Xanthovirga aplysinae TaxID=2529853 RepID=UPI0012BBCC28|nr:histidine kinase [Xanthovirga aplysinae]MTI30810.1 histidine kinase [Xanthovirga aplysinae]